MSDWIGPCEHGSDPWDRCDTCSELDESTAMLKRLWAVERWLATEQAVVGRLRDRVAAAGNALAEKGMAFLYPEEQAIDMTLNLRAANSQLKARVAELEDGLTVISEGLPCDEPCGPTYTKCQKCGDKGERWCAGCIARAALTGARKEGVADASKP